MVIFEIQQNSDTTYRVFDWNRTDRDGKPRDLHVEQSLACIDFADTSPDLNPPGATTLADCPFFRVERHTCEAGAPIGLGGCCLLGVVAGTVRLGDHSYGPGSFVLVPADASLPAVAGRESVTLLEIRLP